MRQGGEEVVLGAVRGVCLRPRESFGLIERLLKLQVVTRLVLTAARTHRRIHGAYQRLRVQRPLQQNLVPKTRQECGSGVGTTARLFCCQHHKREV